ncbi:ROK family protein, partial [Streptomyces hainanensis]
PSPGTPLGVGIAVPGPLDADAGVVLDPPLFGGWHDIPLRAALAERLNLPVTVEKDATAAAIGERWIGAAERSGDFVYLYLGTGAGCGAFLNGDVYRGRTGNAGEFGQLCALAVGRLTPEGGPAMVDECAPMASAARKARAAGLPLPDSPAAYERLCAAAAGGDERAVAAVREVARVVARGASGVTDLLDTGLLIVGGPAVPPAVAGLFLTEISEAVNRFPVARRVRRVHVAHSLLNESAAAIGAASGVFHAAFAPRLRTGSGGQGGW